MLKIIVAHDKNRLIGRQNQIPWHIRDDLLHYKETTMGHTLIMGSRTFESIGKPLLGRKTIVLCYDKNFDAKGAEVCTDYRRLLNLYEKSEETVYVCGGASVYALFLPYCEELIVSVIEGDYTGDTYFPEYEHLFKEEREEQRNGFAIRYYKRRK